MRDILTRLRRSVGLSMFANAGHMYEELNAQRACAADEIESLRARVAELEAIIEEARKQEPAGIIADATGRVELYGYNPMATRKVGDELYAAPVLPAQAVPDGRSVCYIPKPIIGRLGRAVDDAHKRMANAMVAGIPSVMVPIPDVQAILASIVDDAVSKAAGGE